jgi:hypothetical protein
MRASPDPVPSSYPIGGARTSDDRIVSDQGSDSESDGLMSEAIEYTIGSQVACGDGVCGELRRVVVDPIARVVTHLVVEPAHRQGSGHLVPVALLDPSARGLRVRCNLSEFSALEDAEETQFLPGAVGPWGYGQNQMLSWPYYGLGMGGAQGLATGPQVLVVDRVPSGEVEVRRGEHVHATDGPIGRVQGLVVDPADHHVTHVLLDHGHLWGHERVAIPIGSVAGVEDGVRLKLCKREVRDLPPIDVDDPHDGPR